MMPPSLVYNYHEGLIEDVVLGPRREVTLKISLMVWEGGTGRHGPSVTVRFGGIENFAAVAEFFAARPQDSSELAYLRYSGEKRSKPGFLFFDLIFERIDAKLMIQCSSLQVSGSESSSETEP